MKVKELIRKFCKFNEKLNKLLIDSQSKQLFGKM